jgi:hypothetical protein
MVENSGAAGHGEDGKQFPGVELKVVLGPKATVEAGARGG